MGLIGVGTPKVTAVDARGDGRASVRTATDHPGRNRRDMRAQNGGSSRTRAARRGRIVATLTGAFVAGSLLLSTGPASADTVGLEVVGHSHVEVTDISVDLLGNVVLGV